MNRAQAFHRNQRAMKWTRTQTILNKQGCSVSLADEVIMEPKPERGEEKNCLHVRGGAAPVTFFVGSRRQRITISWSPSLEPAAILKSLACCRRSGLSFVSLWVTSVGVQRGLRRSFRGPALIRFWGFIVHRYPVSPWLPVAWKLSLHGALTPFGWLR